MKRIALFLTVLFAVCSMSFAQRTIASQDLEGAETINFASMSNAKTVTVTCTNVGGTSDGTLTLFGSTNGTTWSFLNFLGGELGTASPKASITGADLNQVTITTALVATWWIKPDIYPYHKIQAVGTSGDTTTLAVNWSKYR